MSLQIIPRSVIFFGVRSIQLLTGWAGLATGKEPTKTGATKSPQDRSYEGTGELIHQPCTDRPSCCQFWLMDFQCADPEYHLTTWSTLINDIVRCGGVVFFFCRAVADVTMGYNGWIFWRAPPSGWISGGIASGHADEATKIACQMVPKKNIFKLKRGQLDSLYDTPRASRWWWWGLVTLKFVCER